MNCLSWSWNINSKEPLVALGSYNVWATADATLNYEMQDVNGQTFYAGSVTVPAGIRRAAYRPRMR